MKPILIIPPGSISKDDIHNLRINGICVVECKSPDLVRFTDVPTLAGYDKIERAAISLSRILLQPTNRDYTMGHKDITRLFVDILLEGEVLRPPKPPEQVPKPRPKPKPKKVETS